MRDDGLGILLKIVGRKMMVARPYEGLEKCQVFRAIARKLCSCSGESPSRTESRWGALEARAMTGSASQSATSGPHTPMSPGETTSSAEAMTSPKRTAGSMRRYARESVKSTPRRAWAAVVHSNNRWRVTTRRTACAQWRRR